MKAWSERRPLTETTMSTLTRPAKVRTVRLVKNGESMALTIREKKGHCVQVDAYFLSRTAKSVVLSKHDGTRYEVKGETCTCPSHKYHPGTVCRHRAAIAKLTELGRL
jgi:hypothetical protein